MADYDELFIDEDGVEYPEHDFLDLFEESFDPDGYTEEDYQALMDRI